LDGGWEVEDTVRFAQRAQEAGCDLIDCSSGGAVPGVRIPVTAGYQVPFAKAVRDAGVPSAAVGAITGAAQADAIVRDGQADVVLLGKQMLRQPQWAIAAAAELGAAPPWPEQYDWAVGRR
jgi:2,4-dienoyl-CoA reductase-like NADH-dependent reductase (Old Yellow Enzyme family)